MQVIAINDLPATIKELAGLVSALGIIILGWFQFRANKKAENSRQEVKQTAYAAKASAQDAKVSADDNKERLTVIHKLVDSHYMAALRKDAKHARELAIAAPSEIHEKEAMEAETLLRQHEDAEQKSSEAQTGTQ